MLLEKEEYTFLGVKEKYCILDDARSYDGSVMIACSFSYAGVGDWSNSKDELFAGK